MDTTEIEKELIAYIGASSKPCSYDDAVMFTCLFGEKGKSFLDKMIENGKLSLIDGIVSLRSEHTHANTKELEKSLIKSHDNPGEENTFYQVGKSSDRQLSPIENDEPKTMKAPALFDSEPISVLDLSARSAHAFTRRGIEDIRGLIANLDAINNMSGIGQKSINEIKIRIAERALPPIKGISDEQSLMLEDISCCKSYVFDEFGILHSSISKEQRKSARILPPELDRPLSELKLKPFIVLAFGRCGIKSISQAIAMSDDELLSLPNIGQTKVDALRIACSEALIAQNAEEAFEDFPELSKRPFENLDPELATIFDNALSELKDAGYNIRADEWKALSLSKAIDILADPYDSKAHRLAHEATVAKSGIEQATALLSLQIENTINKESFKPIELPDDDAWIEAASAIGEANEHVQFDQTKKILIPVYPSLSQWLGSLEQKKQDILSARLSGRTLEECGHEFNLTRERIRQICSKEISLKPILKEDVYRPLYAAYKIDVDAFCKVTGEPVSTYNLLNLEGLSKGSRPLSEAVDDPDIPEHVKEAISRYERRKYILISGEKIPRDKRKIIEALVRTYAFEKAISLDDLYNLYVETLESEGLLNNKALNPTNRRAFGVILDRVDNVINAPHPTSVNNGRGIRYYEFDSMDFSRLSRAIEFGPLQNIECSTALIMRDERYTDIVQEFDIRDEYELHHILRNFCPQTKRLSLCRTPNIVIGYATRNEQVLELIQDMKNASRDELAKEYERRYGVAVATFLANYLKDFAGYEHNGKYSCSSAKLTTEQIAFIKDQFVGEYMSLALARMRFENRFPGCDPHAVNSTNLYSAGFTVHESLLVKRRVDLRTAFKHLIRSRPTFSIHDEGFGPDVASDTIFQSELSKAVGRFEIIEYEKGRYVSLEALQASCPWLERCMFQNYADEACEFFARETPFNANRLARHGFSNKLDRLRGEIGVEDYFFDSIIATNYVGGKVKRTSVNETPVFCVTSSTLSTSDILEYIVGEEESVEIDDLVDLLKEEFGIETTAYLLRGAISRSSVYYHQGLEMVFDSIEAYERKARQWI